MVLIDKNLDYNFKLRLFSINNIIWFDDPKHDTVYIVYIFNYNYVQLSLVNNVKVDGVLIIFNIFLSSNIKRFWVLFYTFCVIDNLGKFYI